ncbi:MAG: 4-hydroxybenzoate octaprenyltransferase, partial [Planctomycetes bacterium]|nr:4-hydroxybenzoate octaprenyltransferase [Planctomycetota bacterium]
MSAFLATLRMIKFEHSIFALPFAMSGAWLAARGIPGWLDLLLISIAAISARSAAMAFNRLVDRRLDASNPRTQDRELVTGAISSRFAAFFTLANAAIFVSSAFFLAPICGWLSLPVLVVLLGYSWLKRLTWLCHFGLGLALGCAPAGAWLAVSKDFLPGWDIPLWMGAAVLAWVGGFDLLYAIQDVKHDLSEGLFSLPSRLGNRASRWVSMALFVLAVAIFAHVGRLAELSWPYSVGLLCVSLLLLTMHWLLRGGREQHIPLAFFRVNAWVGVVYFAGLWGAVSLG